MFLSVFDLCEIGIGPRSSRTMGPVTAAARFLAELKDASRPRPAGSVVFGLRLSLHGSLAFTGVGHATERAVVLGLCDLLRIERDAFGAVKAVTAASLALKGEGLHVVPLDDGIETMRRTGRGMNHRDEETRLGGLAVNLPEG